MVVGHPGSRLAVGIQGEAGNLLGALQEEEMGGHPGVEEGMAFR